MRVRETSVSNFLVVKDLRQTILAGWSQRHSELLLHGLVLWALAWTAEHGGDRSSRIRVEAEDVSRRLTLTRRRLDRCAQLEVLHPGL